MKNNVSNSVDKKEKIFLLKMKSNIFIMYKLHPSIL